MQAETNLFTRRDTRIVKGVAVLMMMAHHIFGFWDRLPEGYSYNLSESGVERLSETAWAFKICVALFMFLGGYGLCKQRENGKGSLLKSVWRQYVQYWKVFLIFVPIGFLFFSGQGDYCADTVICHVYDDFQIRQLISNFIGWTSEYNREWWFFRAYLCASFIGTVYMYIIPRSRGGFWKEVLIVVALASLWPELWAGLVKMEPFTEVSQNLLLANIIVPDRFCYCFLMGIVFARYDGIQKARQYLLQYRKLIRLGIGVLGSIVLLIARAYLFADYLDIFLTPLLVICISEVFSVLSPLGMAMAFLGKYSADMWLIHGFYCYYFYDVVKVVFISNEPVLAMTILTALTLGTSIALEGIYAALKRVSRNGKCFVVNPTTHNQFLMR